MCNITLSVRCTVFMRDAIAYRVIATVTSLADSVDGCVAGWLSHSHIVSKRLNVSDSFFDDLKAPSV